MAHTNLLLGTNWSADEWPESVDVMHEGAGNSLKYVPERTYIDINKARSDFGKNVFNDDTLDDFDKFEKIYQICQEIVETLEFTCWIERTEQDEFGSYDYLSCGHIAMRQWPEKTQYCPNCGAKVVN